jgi:hypothetical protein
MVHFVAFFTLHSRPVCASLSVGGSGVPPGIGAEDPTRTGLGYDINDIMAFIFQLRTIK